VAPTAQAFDRHSGVKETSWALYLFPSLVDLDKATQPQLSLPPHLARMLPLVAAGYRAATMAFLAEALKPKETGNNTPSAEMSPTGVWSERNPRSATAEQGRRDTELFVDATLRLIVRWKEPRPLQRP
jgi:creatinine amidohydrolase